MTSAASRDGEIPFDQVPGRWAELAARADRHEQLRLIRDGDAPALVVMTEEDFDQAVQDAADLALCREILAGMDPIDPAQADARNAEFARFLQGVASRTS